jgi:hypothetical protein
MNWAWRDGKMSVEHYKEEHELDTETLAETDAEPAVEPNPAAANVAGAKPESRPEHE